MFVFATAAIQAQWVHSSNGLPNGFGFYESVNMVAKGGNTLYASQNQRLFLSHDDGTNWVEITANFPSGARFTFMAGNNTRVFVAFDTLSAGNVRSGNLYYSDDEGTTWVNTGEVAGANTFDYIAVDGENIYVHSGSNKILRSEDNGNTWTQLSAPERGNLIAFVGTDLYFGTDHGLHKSTDKGENWTQVPGIPGTFSITSTDEAIYIGTSPKIHKSTDNGTTWEVKDNGFPTGGIDTKWIFAEGSTTVASSYRANFSAGISISNDGGETWSAFNEGFPSVPKIGSFVKHNNYLYAAASVALFQNGGIYKCAITDLTTAIEQINSLPQKFTLEQNYPNPFNPETKIKFTLPAAGHTELIIFNIQGEEVASLINETLNAGSYSYNWNANGMPSGIYFCRMNFDGNSLVQKMILMK